MHDLLGLYHQEAAGQRPQVSGDAGNRRRQTQWKALVTPPPSAPGEAGACPWEGCPDSSLAAVCVCKGMGTIAVHQGLMRDVVLCLHNDAAFAEKAPYTLKKWSFMPGKGSRGHKKGAVTTEKQPLTSGKW